MKFLKNVLILIVVLVVVALINRWYLGGFTKLEAKEVNMPPYTIAYTGFVGEYGKVGPTMAKVQEILSGAGVASATGVGIYYDDPAVVSGANLRSDIGAMVDQRDIRKLLIKKDIKIMRVPGGNRIVVEFPFKNTISYMIGPMKAYPVIAKYIQDKGYGTGGSMTELYDMAAKKIYYIADITK